MKLIDPAAAEIAGYSGFDFVIVDARTWPLRFIPLLWSNWTGKSPGSNQETGRGIKTFPGGECGDWCLS